MSMAAARAVAMGRLAAAIDRGVGTSESYIVRDRQIFDGFLSVVFKNE